MQSLLIEGENIVNSRPLTHLAVSPQDVESPTPNYFLLGAPNIAQTPPVRVPDDKILKLKMIVRCLRYRFWKNVCWNICRL